MATDTATAPRADTDADARLAAAHFAACAPYEDDPVPCTTPSGPVGTGTLMPLVCFQCSMLLNNKQHWFEQQQDDILTMSRSSPCATTKDLFDALHLAECCRINLSRAAKDPRLHFDTPFLSSLVTIERASRLQAPPTTLATNGHTRVFYKNHSQ